MSLNVRRIVTGHDPDGRPVVLIDGPATNVTSRRPGMEASVIWTTEGFPVNGAGDEDASTRSVGTSMENGTVFRVVEYQPGVTPRRHRSNSLDYAVVISGEIDMELDEGVEVHLEAGDLLVQRGTIHNWINRGSEPCRIAFVLIDAEPPRANDETLEAFG